jgi:pyruvate/2-oxoglutarate dehydrogenase complex dihydrolipoamide dehydrogenase (E3) component
VQAPPSGAGTNKVFALTRVVDRASCRLLGCHVVGERAVEITQLAAIAIAAQMPVDELARVAVSFPTYAEILVHAAIRAAVELDLPLRGQAEQLRMTR